MTIIWYITIHYDILYRIMQHDTLYIYIYIHTYIYTYIYIWWPIIHVSHIMNIRIVGIRGFRWDQKDASGQCGLMEKNMDYATWHRASKRDPSLGATLGGPRKHRDVSDLSKEHRISSDLLHFSWSSIKWFKQQSLTNILWMKEILHHFGWLKPWKEWDKAPINGAGFRNHPQYEDIMFVLLYRQFNLDLMGINTSNTGMIFGCICFSGGLTPSNGHETWEFIWFYLDFDGFCRYSPKFFREPMGCVGHVSLGCPKMCRSVATARAPRVAYGDWQFEILCYTLW